MNTHPSGWRGPSLESPILWRRARDLFDRLATMTDSAGKAVLERETALDPELRRAVGKLLDHDRCDDFLEIPWSPPEPGTAASEDAPWLGSRIGPYRLVQEIGRGGSGIVFLAERDDAEFEHQVAVKVLSQAPSPGARQRFLRERQILARLNHPHIARLIGGGTVPEGLPYVIMEVVDGLSVTAWCDRRQLSIEGRLELFCDVCDAVQYAHRNLVVHRDLKPSNILVTPAGQVKLLDFGIAKPLDDGPPSEESADPTLCMTPSYASPEQILGRRITTSSDVYSLGILLYEILCGRRPHEGVRGELLGLEASISVAAPSQAWDRDTDDGDSAAKLASAASARGLSARHLRRRLRGDLDHIVMRALRQEPDQRWVSVEQMAAGIRRHLAGSPGEARRVSVLYHAAKLVRRNRMAVLVAAALGVFVLGRR